MAEYYVVKNKNTGLYFRGKGVNRWGKHYNQASVYRIKANAENTIKEVSWRGEQAEVVPIQIIEGNADVAMEIFEEIDKFIKTGYEINGKIMDENRFIDLEKCKHLEDIAYGKYCVFEELEDIIAELKKKYTEDKT